MAKLHNLQNINGENVYSDYQGGNVYRVAQDALDVAVATGQTVTMAFNQARVKVTGKEASSREISDKYFAECERLQQEYENSPAGKREAAREAALQKREQAAIDTLVYTKLDDAIKHGIAGVIGWMADYAARADNNTIDGRRGDIIPKLKAAGYQADAYADDEKAVKDLRTNGLYIIGQCLACMEGGMPPHPGYAAAYIEEYKKLRKKAFIPVMHPVAFNDKAGTMPPTTIPVLQKIKLKGPA